MDEPTLQEKFREFLLTKGERLTRERVRIVQEIIALCGPFSIEKLISRLGANDHAIRVSRATVIGR